MNDSLFEEIQTNAKYLNIDLYSSELAAFAVEKNFSTEALEAIRSVFEHLQKRKEESIISTLMRMSRLPLKVPKTFEEFDFESIHGKQVDSLRNLPTLSALHGHRNIAFIGPQGVGKTHLAMAYGHECCKRGYKTYFLKATELNQKFADAIKYGREGSVVNGLVKPSCLIIDEIGRCIFSKEATRLFFDMIDRRYNKEGPNTMIFTSNIGPDKWGEFFSEDSTLLCALDRIFDEATVYLMKGDSYRGRKRETVSLETGKKKNK